MAAGLQEHEEGEQSGRGFETKSCHFLQQATPPEPTQAAPAVLIASNANAPIRAIASMWIFVCCSFHCVWNLRAPLF